MSATYDQGSQSRMSELFVNLISAGQLVQTTVGPGDSGVAHCMSSHCGPNGQPRIVFQVSESDRQWYICSHSLQKFRVPEMLAIADVCLALLNAEHDDPLRLPEALCKELGLIEISYEEYVSAFSRWILPDDLELLHKATLRFLKSFGRLPESADEMRTTRRWPRAVVFPPQWKVTFAGTPDEWTILVRGAHAGVAWRVDQRGEVVAVVD